MKKKTPVLLFLAAICFALLTLPAALHAAQYASWNEIIDAMHISLDKAYDAYTKKDPDGARDMVNDAYFGYYEKEGVERAVMSYISGKRATTVEYQFSAVKKLIGDGASTAEVRKSLDNLKTMLREDADKLDGKEESAAGTFIASLLIILREGFEAILVIAAIVAYLIRSGNPRLVKTVYGSGVAALAASVAAAVALQYIFKVSGANQEILEGAAMLLAVVVLFFVSNWMVSKAEAEAWKNYIEGKVQSAVSKGSKFALGAAAFLAVFREGAETILFYQALLAETSTHKSLIWGGLFVGCVALVFIFAIVRYGSLALPIKPFFLGTGVLMYIMSIAFAGGGIKEFQEADVIGVTPVGFVQSIDILGIYPTVETLAPQVVLLALAAASIFYYRAKGRKALSARVSGKK